MKYKIFSLLIISILSSCITSANNIATDNQSASITENVNNKFIIQLFNGTSNIRNLPVSLTKKDGTRDLPVISSVTDADGKVYFDESGLVRGTLYYITIGKNDQGYSAGRCLGFQFSDSDLKNGYKLYALKELEVKHPRPNYYSPADTCTFKWDKVPDAAYYSVHVFQAFKKDNSNRFHPNKFSTRGSLLESVTAGMFRPLSIEKRIFFEEPVFTSEKIYLEEYTIPQPLQANGSYYFSINGYDSDNNIIASNGYTAMTTSPNRLFYKDRNTGEITQEKEKYRAIALSGILNEHNDGRHDTLEADTFCRDIELSIKRILNEDWGIENREDFLAVIDRVIEGGHSKSYTEIAVLLKAHPKKAIPDIAFDNEYSYDLTKRFYIVKYTLDITKKNSLRAWDLARCINLARWGYQVHYINEKEAWDIILPLAEKIYAQYSSWKEFAINYIAGRMFWASSFSEENEKREEAIEAYYRLIAQPDLPWRKGWDGSEEVTADSKLYIQDELDFPISHEEKSWDLFLSGLQDYKNNKINDAIKNMKESITLYSQHSHVHFMLGYIFFNENDFSIAAKSLENAIVLKDDMVGPYILLSYIYREEDVNKSVKIIETGLEKCKDKNTLLLNLGRLELLRKNFKKSVSIANRIIAAGNVEEGILADSHVLLAQAYFGMNDFDASLENIFVAEKHIENKSYIYYLAGICFLSKGHEYSSQALEYLKKAEAEGYAIPENVKKKMNEMDNNI